MRAWSLGGETYGKSSDGTPSLPCCIAALYLHAGETIGTEESFAFGCDVFPLPFEQMDSGVAIGSRVGILVRSSNAEKEKNAER